METINASLVLEIEEITAQWEDAVRRVGEVLIGGWANRSAQAGLERGALVQIGKCAERRGEFFGLEKNESWGNIGAAAYAAYRQGIVQNAVDIANA